MSPLVNCSHINELDVRLSNFSIQTSVDKVMVFLPMSACRGQQRSACRGQHEEVSRGQPVEVSRGQLRSSCRGQLLEVTSARDQLEAQSVQVSSAGCDYV